MEGCNVNLYFLSLILLISFFRCKFVAPSFEFYAYHSFLESFPPYQEQSNFLPVSYLEGGFSIPFSVINPR
jgi:hypothetical protein